LSQGGKRLFGGLGSVCECARGKTRRAVISRFGHVQENEKMREKVRDQLTMKKPLGPTAVEGGKPRGRNVLERISQAAWGGDTAKRKIKKVGFGQEPTQTRPHSGARLEMVTAEKIPLRFRRDSQEREESCETGSGLNRGRSRSYAHPSAEEKRRNGHTSSAFDA